MVATKSVVSALALSAVAAAAPAPTKTTFSVDQVAINGSSVHPAVKYARALAKYGATIPANVASAAASGESGTATNTPAAGDQEYIVPVDVGGTTLHLDFDSGSSDLWVYTADTKGAEKGHSVYSPSSSAKKLDGYTWKISYVDGSGASGDVYQDTVVVAGVTATAQAVEAAETISSEFAGDKNNDGLLGLAFSSENTVKPQKQKTFFANVLDSLASPVFAANLKHQAAGTYDFGYIDDSKYSGSLTYTDVDNSEGAWQFTADGYSVGSSDGNGYAVSRAGSSFSAVADTGTTLALFSQDILEDYYGQIQSAQYDDSQGAYVFDCDDDVPDFNIQIGSYTATISSSLINMGDNGDGTCYGGIQSNEDAGINILGDVFLKSQYVVFDAGKLQLGFAPQK